MSGVVQLIEEKAPGGRMVVFDSWRAVETKRECTCSTGLWKVGFVSREARCWLASASL